MKRIVLLFGLLLVSCVAACAVSLAWNASPTSDVVGYRVRWGFAQGGPYANTVEAGSALSITVDEPWPLGSTVYFTAYAYNASNLESLPSNEVSYTVPIPTPTPVPSPTPAPPNNLRLLLDTIAKWWAERFNT